MGLDAETILRWRIRWKDQHRCKCVDCNRAMLFAENYAAVKDGAPFKPEMLMGLDEDMLNAFLELVCLRAI